MTLRYRLLELLADARFHSGEALGQALGVTRAAIWKQIHRLGLDGVDIQSVRGRGYRLVHPVELLDESIILSHLPAPLRARLPVLDIHQSIASTNSYLRERAAEGAASGSVCLAEAQSAGRGRRGRSWVSPFAANLYLSILWRFSGGPADLGGLSLAASVAVLRALRAAGVSDLGLKWPSDILWQDSKLAGVLVEVGGEYGGPSHAVIGVGVNVHMPQTAAMSIDQRWADLHMATNGTQISRNCLAAAVIENCVGVCEEFDRHGFAAFQSEWEQHDLARGRTVSLHGPRGDISGTACGIDVDGALLLRTGNKTQRLTSGELSLRMSS